MTGRWTVPNLHANDNVSFACTVHANGRCLITVSLHAGACKWSVHACPACMHKIYSKVRVHCYAFLHVSLLLFVRKKIWMVPSWALRLPIFLYSKRGAGKRQEVGPACHGARASECARRGGRARVRCGADGGGVGARAVAGYRAKRASERHE